MNKSFFLVPYQTVYQQFQTRRSRSVSDKNVRLNFQEKNIELLTHNYFIKNILEIRCMWYEQSGRQQLPYINGESLCKISYHHWFYVIIERITSIVGPTLSILYFILRFANFMFAVDVVLRYSSLFLLFFR